MTMLPFEEPEDYRTEEEPSSLRRQKRAETHRDRRRWWLARHRRLLLVLAVVLAGAGSAGWAAARFLLDDPRFHFRSLHLREHQFVESSQVEDKFTFDRGRSILRIPLRERREEIEQIPWVRSATITRALPDQLWVRVEERAPVGFVWTEAGLSLVDDEGVILDPPPGFSATFPVVRGVAEQESAAERRSRMQLYTALLEDLDRGDSHLREEISEVDLTDPQDVRIVVADSPGAVLLHLGKENFLSRYLIYASQLGQWKRQFSNIRSVDLRFDGQVVINADAPQQLPLPAWNQSLQATAPPTPSLPAPPPGDRAGRNSLSQ